MLSHYPFYNLFARFLEQIYHTSLSAAPLPLERYITNFVKELPLPPQGRVEVLYSLPAQSILQISRPPPNRLPMVDFSYRPLFIFLSVDSILTIFTALCMEMTICVVAKNISVLTPVQEALLSFLYPFVWQGCYIPILPIQMIDILDAPVPLLVGISSEYFDSTPAEQRPRSVMFVDLDNDEIYQPSYDAFFGAGRTLPPIPKSKLPKLRKKLVEFGECIYRKPDQFAKLHIAGYPFNKNQHLRPIQSFTAEQGIIAKANVMGVSSTDIHSALAKSGIKKISDSKSGHAVPYRHPVACSLVFSSTSSMGYEESILDPKNNISDKDTFDAREIRDAFLRFFVASLIDYTDFIVDESDTSSVVSSLKSNKKRSLLNILHTNSTHNNSILNMTDKKYLFDIEAYGANQTEPFIKQL